MGFLSFAFHKRMVLPVMATTSEPQRSDKEADKEESSSSLFWRILILTSSCAFKALDRALMNDSSTSPLPRLSEGFILAPRLLRYALFFADIPISFNFAPASIDGYPFRHIKAVGLPVP